MPTNQSPHFPAEQFPRLVRQLASCRMLSDSTNRRALVETLPAIIKQHLPAEPSSLNAYLLQLLHSCNACVWGLDVFLDVLRALEGSSSAMQEIDTYIDKITHRCIVQTHLTALKNTLDAVNLPEDRLQTFFELVNPNSTSQPQATEYYKLQVGMLNLLARSMATQDDQHPLCQFVALIIEEAEQETKIPQSMAARGTASFRQLSKQDCTALKEANSLIHKELFGEGHPINIQKLLASSKTQPTATPKNDFGDKQEPPPPLQPVLDPPLILFDIEEAHIPDHYILHGWSWYKNTYRKITTEMNLNHTSLKQQILSICRHECRNESKIEINLRQVSLDDLEHGTKAITGREPEPLGSRYHAYRVLRMIDIDLDKRKVEEIESKWQKIKDDTKLDDRIHYIRKKSDLYKPMIQKKLAKKDCLVITLPIKEQDDLHQLSLLLETGIWPIVIWIRPPLSRASQEAFLAALPVTPIHNIPELVRDTRIDAWESKRSQHIGYRLTFFWDKGHSLPVLQFQPPSP